MMKRYLTVLIALVAIAMGAKAAVIDYGFKIGGNAINSGNYQLINKDKPWYYDPENNVLHLTDGELSSNGDYYLLEVNSDVNSSLTIQVDGYFRTGYLRNRAIVFNGEGTHTICGEGTLKIEPQVTNVSGMIKTYGKTKLTIKDLNLNITTYGSRDEGFENYGFSEIILDNCEIHIKSGFSAWYAIKSVDPILINCFLARGVFYGGGVVESAGSSNWMKEISIVRQYPITNAAITVDNPTADEVVPNSCQIDHENCTAELSWVIVNGDNSINNVTPGSVFELGKVYRAVVRLESTSEYLHPFSSDASITINGHQASINVIENRAAAIVTYTFPQLANTYYDVWVGGKQVNDYNQKDVLGDGGSVKYSKTLGFHSLTLENAIITNTGNPDYELTGYGRGIYTTMPNLTIRVKGDNTIESKGEGIYFTGNLSILGITDNLGKLSVKGSYGIRPYRNSEEKTLTIGGVDLTAEGTSGAGIGASASFSSGNYNCTMKVGSAKTVVKTKGTSVSLGNLKSLVFEDGLQIVQPSGAYFDDEDVRNTSGIISNQWVVIKYNPSISTDINAIDNGQLTMDNSLPLYNLHGQRVSHPVKGQIYIQNGRKVKF